MAYQTILYEVTDGVVEITLNRPDKLNAVSAEMQRELADAITRVEAGRSIRCLLLTGAGRGFCPGQDLSERTISADAGPPDLSRTLKEGYYPFLKRLMNLDIPTVCAVNGVAAGAGANLALACDIVLAAETAKFTQVFTNIGLIPDCGGTWMLPRLVGLAKAKALAFLATPVPAAEAEAMGMIYRAVPAEELMDEARRLAQTLAKRATYGISLTKKAMMASSSNDLDTQLELEAQLQQKGGFSHDYNEGVSAFFEKRQPNFKGN